MDDLSLKLTKLRKQNGISQKELGDLLGVTNRAVSKWESGVSLPSSANLLKLARIFGIELNDFYGEAEYGTKTVKSVGMESIRELYKIGCGPSSSHTMGPEKACKIFKQRNPNASKYKVVLYGSLAKTGKGHCCDSVIRKTFAPMNCLVEFNISKTDIPHPNTMELFAFENDRQIDFARVFSIGGGDIRFENDALQPKSMVYEHNNFSKISEYCASRRLRLWQYVSEKENADFEKYMLKIWNAMRAAVERGLDDEGVLPGTLHIRKKAKYLYNSQHVDESEQTRENRIVCAYAFAVSEQNASGETVVTAPTCGSCGVVPAVLYYYQNKRGYSDTEIVHALETAGIIGNLIKTNASISGAECGCQVEIGSACAMAAAALGELFGLNTDKIEYAAEMAIEHHLGLTCDPIGGYVQIPCIERNAVAAMRAVNAVSLAGFLSDTRKISFDNVVEVMKKTGRDMPCSYKETSEGGLATIKL